MSTNNLWTLPLVIREAKKIDDSKQRALLILLSSLPLGQQLGHLMPVLLARAGATQQQIAEAQQAITAADAALNGQSEEKMKAAKDRLSAYQAKYINPS